MKKLFLTLVMLLTLAIASVASAAGNGKILDAEEAAADKFINAKDYKTAMSVMTAEMIGNWDEESYNNLKQHLNQDFGKLTIHRLREVIKADDLDALTYQVVGSTNQKAIFRYIFKLNGEIPRLQDFGVALPQPAEADQQQAAESK